MRPELFCPPGRFSPLGESLFFCAHGTAKPPRGAAVPLPPSPPGGKKVTKKNGALRGLGLTRNPLGAFLLRAHQRGSRSAVQNMEGVSTALCLQPRVFDTRLSNSPYASFALSHVNPRANKKQCRVGTPTTLCSRLLKAGGWPQKLLLTRPKFCTRPRDPR